MTSLIGPRALARETLDASLKQALKSAFDIKLCLQQVDAGRRTSAPARSAWASRRTSLNDPADFDLLSEHLGYTRKTEIEAANNHVLLRTR